VTQRAAPLAAAAAGLQAGPRGLRWTALTQGLFARLLAAFLIASVPSIALLAIILTRQESAVLTSNVSLAAENVSRAATSKLEAWFAERENDLIGTALVIRDAGLGPDIGDELAGLSGTKAPTDLFEATDPSGRVVAASAPDLQIDATAQPWFAAATRGYVLTEPRLDGGRVVWIEAAPILDAAGHLEGVLVANLRLSALSQVLTSLQLNVRVPYDMDLVNRQEQILYSTDMQAVTTTADMLAAGALRAQNTSEPVQLALKGGNSNTRYTDAAGSDRLAGYDSVEPIGWALVVDQSAAAALQPIADQTRVAIGVSVAAGVIALLIGFLVTRSVTGPVAALAAAAERMRDGMLHARVTPAGATEVRRLGGAFNAMAAEMEAGATRTQAVSREMATTSSELASLSDELVATTTDQSASSTETSTSMEELARSAASIAETMDRVAGQADETCTYLRDTRSDIEDSSRRTTALAQRVNEINALLELINEIADQTNLLSLNAAIEAARAGESGRGFSVVAEEVRRLAERSKGSASDIAQIISSTQTETAATVMAMEKSSRQMQRSLELMEGVTGASHEVGQITQQQRAATDQVVEAIEQVSHGSQLVSATARQLAEAAAAQARSADELQHAARLGTAG
jgi:methyl-accepting chemotaxis protein